MKVSAKSVAERVSLKHSLVIAERIRNKKLETAKELLQSVLTGERTFDGKVFPKATQAFLTLLDSAAANARQKNMNIEKLFVKIAKADKGYKYVRPKSLAKFRGREAKITNLEIVLEER